MQLRAEVNSDGLPDPDDRGTLRSTMRLTCALETLHRESGDGGRGRCIRLQEDLGGTTGKDGCRSPV